MVKKIRIRLKITGSGPVTLDWIIINFLVRCGGLVVSVPATRSVHPEFHPGFKSRPVALLQSGLRGDRSLCEYSTNKVIKH